MSFPPLQSAQPAPVSCYKIVYPGRLVNRSLLSFSEFSTAEQGPPVADGLLPARPMGAALWLHFMHRTVEEGRGLADPFRRPGGLILRRRAMGPGRLRRPGRGRRAIPDDAVQADGAP